MFHWKSLWACALSLVLALSATGQITINGVADKQTYPDSVVFTIVAQAGYTYSAFLNTNPVPVGVAVTVNRPDFYQLYVIRTNDTTSAVEYLLRRFIIFATERGATENTELGLPPHTPWPVIQSSAVEFEGASLRLLAPQDFPAGYEIPVVAWVIDADGHAVRANGLLASSGQRSIQLRRGVGAGLLASNNPPGLFNYAPTVGGLATNKTINLEAATSWTSVSGTLAGATAWPANARIRVTGHLAIPAGATLTIGAGAIVLLNSGVNFTNDGSVLINGTVEQPVVFMPNSTNQPWGGFFMRTSTGLVDGTGAIFTGSGADPNGGAGHRPEQCLFFVNNAPQVTLTDSAAFDLKGQLAHAANGGTFNFNRFLLQRCTTGGEYTGAWFRANDSAFIECPDASANFVDGDNDALYFVNAPAQGHGFTNTLIGWTKDDGVDSGGSGYGPLSYQSCWFEATFHEGNSLSGFKNTRAWDTVYIDCGQGIENGYDGPTGRVERCLFTACQSGIRHGDNYQTFSGYDGLMTATNCISIYNHRDLFGYNWDNQGGWTNNWGRMIASGNLITLPDTSFPNNTVWNPAADAWRLAAFGAKGRAGVALAVRPGQSTLGSFPDGVPVGLSMPCTNEVAVDYVIDGTDGTHLMGTLRFEPGAIHKYIGLPGTFSGVLQLVLSNPMNAEFTGASTLLLQSIATQSQVSLSPLGANWKYLDNGTEQGTAWRAPGLNDSSWSNGVARLGFGPDAAANTTIRKFVPGSTTVQITNFYFRHAFSVADLSPFQDVQFRYQRDDGCIVYLNGVQLFTNNMPPPPITANTFASTTISPATATQRFWTNTFPASVLQAGANLLAVEVHQATATSSDIAWEMEVIGIPPAPPPRVNISRLGPNAVLYWTDPSFTLEQSPAAVPTSWSPAGPASPIAVPPTNAMRVFRLRK
jgi:hypothetical protein